MKINKRYLVYILAFLVWVLAVGGLVAFREYHLSSTESVKARLVAETSDSKNYYSGKLKYEFSEYSLDDPILDFDIEEVEVETSRYATQLSRTIFLVYEVENAYIEPTRVTLEEPDSGNYLEGSFYYTYEDVGRFDEGVDSQRKGISIRYDSDIDYYHGPNGLDSSISKKVKDALLSGEADVQLKILGPSDVILEGFIIDGKFYEASE